MEIATWVLQAVGLFVATNIDDSIVLSLFYARGAGRRGVLAGAALGVLPLLRRLLPLAVLGALGYRNLDEVAALAGRFTTTEVMCRHVFEELAAAAQLGRLGDDGRLRRIRVTMHESHAARAWYEADLH